ncbi:beta-microseminoprotein-like [Eleutherodactylus coqui]|uniref:beta-microseminoprotein-like n=1 Tax=Eleutherodactylus coqui TaxID=57060 RepID=UPI003461D0D3
MTFLLRILVAAAMMSLCSAQCTTEPVGNIVHSVRKRSVHLNHPGGCIKEGEFHKEGETWQARDCTKCTCCSDHIDCCMNALKPVVEDRENCSVYFNKATCLYEIKQHNYSGKPCKADSWIA